MPLVPRRYEMDDDYRACRPIHVVWELTLACNLKCAHCGSRAGRPRVGELSTAECLDLIGQLARLGVRQVSLIGGEAYLRSDWLEIIRAIRANGMDCSMQTGGRGLTEKKIRLAAQAGLMSCGVSVDGLKTLHDQLRGFVGSYGQAMAVLGYLKKLGVPSSVNTQITSKIMPELRELMHHIADAGATNWQIQLTVAMGNAADNSELLVQPYELLKIMPLLAELHAEAMELGLLLQPSNTIGYFGPYEHQWRIVDDAKGHWQGCVAGHTGIGIEADGTLKGCPSLPTHPYAAGNIRDMSADEIWRLSEALRFTRDRTVEDLWGFCRTCYYADVCRAGCTWMSHVLFGRPGNNPYCHYRAIQLAKGGYRERIVKVEDAPGEPFDHGRFQLIREPLEGDGPRYVAEPPPPRQPSEHLWQIRVRARSPRKCVPERSLPEHGRVPPVLELCHGCDQYVMPDTITCPHCGCDVRKLAMEFQQSLAEAKVAASELRCLLEEGTEGRPQNYEEPDCGTKSAAPR
jgi:Y-X(10)_GDL-associated radical SAM protein